MGMVLAKESTTATDFQGRPAFLECGSYFPVIFGNQFSEYRLVVQNFLVHQGDFPIVTPHLFQFLVKKKLHYVSDGDWKMSF